MAFRASRVLAAKLGFLALAGIGPFVFLFWHVTSVSIQLKSVRAPNPAPSHSNWGDTLTVYGVIGALVLAYLLALALMARTIVLNHRERRD